MRVKLYFMSLFLSYNGRIEQFKGHGKAQYIALLYSLT